MFFFFHWRQVMTFSIGGNEWLFPSEAMTDFSIGGNEWLFPLEATNNFFHWRQWMSFSIGGNEWLFPLEATNDVYKLVGGMINYLVTRALPSYNIRSMTLKSLSSSSSHIPCLDGSDVSFVITVRLITKLALKCREWFSVKRSSIILELGTNGWFCFGSRAWT